MVQATVRGQEFSGRQTFNGAGQVGKHCLRCVWLLHQPNGTFFDDLAFTGVNTPGTMFPPAVKV
jgi:hypothetical protein